MASKVDRLAALEVDALRRMTDAELEALAAQGPAVPWLRELTDAELERIIAGGPLPRRFADRT